MRKRLRLGASLLATLWLIGCGYALVGKASNIPESIQKVYIKPLQNRTQRSEVEQILTRAIADEMVTRRRFTVVNSPEGADAELVGAVTSFSLTPRLFDDQGRTTEYELTLTAEMRFSEIGAEEPIWKNDHYIFKESYPVEGSEESYFDQEKLAIEEAAGKFAESLVIDLMEGF
jgi:outer membrane lipopolysaccharide assembly protein LptE/RlpB